MATMLRKQFLETSRGRIAALLQQGGLTAEEMASRLDLTPNAIRAQLAAMERDSLVRRAGQRRGATRPSHVFELTAEAQQLLSGLYMPMLTHLVEVSAQQLRADHLRRIMRQAGRALAADFPAARGAGASLDARVRAANELMIKQLGTLTQVERKSGGLVIRGAACPIAAITSRHPSACLMIEGFLREVVGAPVRACCNRQGRPRCCFEIRRR
jgi:predicted ArsR family transcriptional regulator